VLDAIPEELPLRTVVHAAGTVDDGMLDSLTPNGLSAVLASKAVAARHLHELTSDADLSAFILFSGMAGTVGAAGQGNYAAANAYLDALAADRRAAGLPATSIAWGWWDAGGMSTSNPEAMERLRRSGVIPMPPERALAALQQTLDRDETNVCLADTDWELFARTFTATRQSPLIAELVGTHEENAGESLVRLPTDPAERDRVVLDLVRTHTSQVLRGSPDDLDVSRGFLDSGFDSLTAVELRNRLTAATGLTLPASLIFDHPTPLAVARHLGEELAQRGTGSDGREAELRAALASIPIKRIEEAGLMADLLRLAGDPGAPERRDEPGSLDEMDVSELVQLAREARESR
jgi:aryl carrier-like protein